MEFFTLNLKATLSAIIMGILVLYLGLGFGLYFFFTMFLFLALSGIVSYIGKVYKQKKMLFEKVRTTKNVLANGTWPLVLALCFYVSHTIFF
ncbi:membrane protein containing DUF92, transmembrane [mine drainage metagenome]|uniref:Membrane protein containing DUF92, transmembrane n=1 Tax=mine drainage metagenome TaxID=410659 RepID=T1BQZ6_9ZZZZ